MHDRLLIRAVHLFALSAFAFAQPLLELLAANPDFFVARGAPPVDILVTPLVILLAPAAAMWGIEWVVALISAALARSVHLGLVAALAGIIALPALRSLFAGSASVELVAAAAVAGGVGIAYARSAALRRFVTVLAAAPVIFLGVYYLDDGLRGLIAPDRPAAVASDVESEIPVVMLVFDELPVFSLLDEHGQIDPVRYPAFARLAATSTWYRNGSTVSGRTLDAIPAILTGRYPPEVRTSPTLQRHPENLFTWLGGHYELNVVEHQTSLSPVEKDLPAWTDRARSLTSDLGLILLHRVLPLAMADRLPPVSRTWENFANAGGSHAHRSSDVAGPADVFDDFVESIAPASTPTLHYLHTALPHWPWLYLPSGKTYFPFQSYAAPATGGSLHLRGSEDWWILESYQRHLLQVEFADRLLGRLIDHLESIDLFDRSILVVVADHGVSFWPEESSRGFAKSRHGEDLLCVPMFVHTPEQRVGRVDSRNAETVDLLPSVADALGVAIPWSVDGCSLLGEPCESRTNKRAFASSKRKHRTFSFDADACFDDATLQRKLAAFGSGSRPYGLYRFGKYAALGGRDVSTLDVSSVEAGEVRLDATKRVGPFGAGAELAPARVTGTVEWSTAAAGDDPHVAVALDGRIQTVVPTPPDASGRPRIAAMLPEDFLPDSNRGSLDLRLYSVVGPSETPQLHPLSVVGPRRQ